MTDAVRNDTMMSVYENAAEASWNAPGTRRLWRDTQHDTYVKLMVLRPDFRALVDAVYHAGREDAADTAENEALRLRGEPFRSGRVGIEYINGMEDAAEIARRGTDWGDDD